MKNKKIVCLLALFLVVLCVAACQNGGDPEKQLQLETPTGVSASDDGVVTWNAVTNATSYIVLIDDVSSTVSECRYPVDLTEKDAFTYCVAAVAAGYKASDFSETKTFTAPAVPPEIVVSLSGDNTVRSGKTTKLSASVSGAKDGGVRWTVAEGGDFATVSDTGVVTATEVAENQKIVVVATSVEDETKSAQKTLTLLAKPQLTQDMLDVFNGENKMSFEGYVKISLYTIGLFPQFYNDYVIDVRTAMDGEYWYAEYRTSADTTAGLYYKNHEGTACQVGINFFNREEYVPMTEEGGTVVSWTDAGLYNDLTELTVADFVFNEDTWRYEYAGTDDTRTERLLAAANPYSFKADGFALIIEEDDVVGIYAKSQDDYQVQQGYKAVQELTVGVNYGDTVTVPQMPKFEYSEEVHGALKRALENMAALESYTLKYVDLGSGIYSSSWSQTGYVEKITADNCYFVPFETQGNNVVYDDDAAYGYIKADDNLYNSYRRDAEGHFVYNRAFAGDFSEAKPTFAFAPEIFNRYFEEEDGSVTYYVNELMFNAASTFYKGVGTESDLYGIFASDVTYNIIPYVTVKDGYIVQAGFYYYLGYLYGLVQIDYGDFNATTLPEGADFAAFVAKALPTQWSDLLFNEVADDDEPFYDKRADDYLKEKFADEHATDVLPFFGEVLGDTYGFGMPMYYYGGDGKYHECVVLYYDVPLDVDYTIDSSVEAVEKYLAAKGFTKNAYGEYEKDGYTVAVVDSDLDLHIYIWKVAAATGE